MNSIIIETIFHQFFVIGMRKTSQVTAIFFIIYYESKHIDIEIAHESLKNYAKTLSLWSFFCYFVGLQDRHLGNILINVKNGNLIFIDYSDIFERNKQRELFPDVLNFRMTKNIENALGVFKGWGIFKLYFVQIYQFFNRNRYFFQEYLKNMIPSLDLNEFGKDITEVMKEMMTKIEKNKYEDIEAVVDGLIKFNTDETNIKKNFRGYSGYI